MLAVVYPAEGEAAHWWFRYAVMLGLSVVVAAMGLSLNSTAVVIGAMLIAPLMTPVLGVSAAIVMAWPGRLGQSALAVLGGAAGAVGVSWALISVLPVADKALTPEVLARTNPDLRDLLVALAAGAAGAYATARDDVSAALPGVAVAVALLPPLAAVGFTLAIGRSDLASGALLLFAVNLVGIAFVGGLVFLASGFVPSGRVKHAPFGIRLGLAASLVATVALGIPLTVATLHNSSRAQVAQAVNEAVATWIKPYPALKLTAVTINGVAVTVDVSGPTRPPSSQSLATSLGAVLGPAAAAQVRWYQTARSPAPHSTRTTVVLSAAQVRPLVAAWLSDPAAAADGTQIVDVTVDRDTVNVELAGPAAPPPAGPLAQAISELAGRAITVSVTSSMR